MRVDNKVVVALFHELLDKNFEYYRESLSRVANNDGDPFAKAREALAQLSEPDRANIIDFFKVIIADSASVVLGTLDGVHFPGELEGDFTVLYDGVEIQGDLMDIFVGKAQQENIYG